MKTVKLIPLMAIAAVAFTFAGCENEGPAEQAGKKIDQTMDTMQEKAEETGDKAMEKLEQAGDKVEDATDSAAAK